MKKAISLFLTLCFLFLLGLSGAEGTVLQFRYDDFEASLPDENWYEGFFDGAATYYYGNPLCTMEDGMIMFLVEKEDSLVGMTLTDDYYTMMYDLLLQDAQTVAVDGVIDSLESTVAGKRSLVYWCRQVIDDSGDIYALAANMTIINGRLLAIMIVHPSMEPEELKDVVLTVGSTVRYTGVVDAGSADTGSTQVSAEDLPGKDDPYLFTPSITAQQNLLLAQWMMDEQTRALCTLLLTLDMNLSQGTFDSSYPTDINRSCIGSADDIILTIIPAQDDTIAFIFQYDTWNQSALYYTEPWNEEALTAFEASCTDQFYANTYDGLEKAAQMVVEAFNNPQ